MRTHDRSRRRRGAAQRAGMTLIEVLAACILLGAMLILAGRMTHSTWRLMRSLPAAEHTRHTLRDAAATLREDVWNSFGVGVGDQHTAVLRQAGERSIVWRIDRAGDRLVRIAGRRGGAVRVGRSRGDGAAPRRQPRHAAQRGAVRESAHSGAGGSAVTRARTSARTPAPGPRFPPADGEGGIERRHPLPSGEGAGGRGGLERCCGRADRHDVGSLPLSPSPRTVRGNRGAGFATIVALALMAMVGAALLLLSDSFSREAKYSAAEGRGAELRQVLRAGTIVATELMRETATQRLTEPRRRAMELPTALAERGGALSATLDPIRTGIERHVVIDAVLDGYAHRQTLVYLRSREGWALSEARLGRLRRVSRSAAATSP